MQMRLKYGFSLIEVLIVIAVIGILVALISPSAQGWRASRELESAAAIALDALNEARERTLQSKDAKQYGVQFEEGAAVVFEGTSFSGSSPSNESMSFGSRVDAQVSLSHGTTTVVFSRLTGEASANGSILLTHQVSSATRTIAIYETGIASEE